MDPASEQTIAVADIGGTHARFALARISGGAVTYVTEPTVLATSQYESFEECFERFARHHQISPEALAISFAGPVSGDELKLTNNSWRVSAAELQHSLGLRHLTVVNDFGAVAHAVANLTDSEFVPLCGPKKRMPERGVISIVGPGTGLGVAAILRNDQGYTVIETEAGHASFAPIDELDEQILSRLRMKFGRVSIERLVSGKGLLNLYEAMAAIIGQPANWAADEKELWAAALDGSDPLAQEALGCFLKHLGAVAGDIALNHGASAVVIAGGLGVRLRDHIESSGFCRHFLAKGRFASRMQALPILLLVHAQPGLFGAAAAFAAQQG